MASSGHLPRRLAASVNIHYQPPPLRWIIVIYSARPNILYTQNLQEEAANKNGNLSMNYFEEKK